jgi:hypothetical protein
MHTQFFRALAIASLVACAACSNVEKGPIGDLRLALSLPNGDTVTVVSFTVLSSSNETLAQGSIDVTDAGATATAIFSVPSSSGDTLVMSAETDSTSCTGSSDPFDVVPAQSVSVDVVMVCTVPVAAPEDGLVHINTTFVEGDTCPQLTSWMASPLEATAPGGTVQVAVAASDPDAGDTLTYNWGSVGTPLGSFADPSAPSTVYTCAAVGSDSLQVVVSDNHQPVPCTATKVFQVTCQP